MALVVIGLTSCKTNENSADGYGHFEADELLLSAELGGKLIAVFYQEGDHIHAGDTLALLDTVSQNIKMQSLDSQIKALESKIPVLVAQREVLKSEISGAEKELDRVRRLKDQGAATIQQYEKLESQVATLKTQLKTFPVQLQSVELEIDALKSQTLQIDELIQKAFIVAPASGFVLERYVNAGELALAGKPLFKTAAMDYFYLRAYISGEQLSSFSIGQDLLVRIDAANGDYQELSGRVTWVASEAEFTPKMIQTKEERVNLVYAIKVRVKNDGQLKIGMPGEILLK